MQTWQWPWKSLVSVADYLMQGLIYIPIEVRRRDFRKERKEADNGGKRLVKDSDDVQWNAQFPERPACRWQRFTKCSAPEHTSDTQDVSQADGAIEKAYDRVESLVAPQNEQSKDENEEH